MGKLIDQLVNLYRNRNYDDNEPVWLNGDPGGLIRDSVTKLLECWGIEISQEIPERRQQFHLERVHIPPIDQRWEDLPLIIAYFYQESLRRRKGAILPKKTSVKYVSLDLLWFLLGYPAWEGFERLRNVVRRSIRDARNETLTLHKVLNSCRDLFRFLKGLLSDFAKSVPNPDNWRQVLANVSTHHLRDRVRGELVGWYLNWDKRERHRIIDDSLVPRIRVDFICQAMTNLIHLFKIGSINEIPRDERNKVEKCFKQRRDGLSEEEVAVQLKFETIKSYDQWTENNHINIRFNRKDTVHDDHRRAERFLFQDISKPQQQDTSEDRTVKILKIMEDDSTIVVGEKKYNLPDKFFKAVRHLALQHVDGNPSVEKHRI